MVGGHDLEAEGLREGSSTCGKVRSRWRSSRAKRQTRQLMSSLKFIKPYQKGRSEIWMGKQSMGLNRVNFGYGYSGGFAAPFVQVLAQVVATLFGSE